MATFEYAEMQAVADELVTEFGQQGTVTRIVEPDPSVGGDPTETAYTAKVLRNSAMLWHAARKSSKA